MEAHTKLSYADYLDFPDDGRRHEIVDGAHVVSPAPVPRHQAVSMQLSVLLHGAIQIPGRGRVFAAPIDVVLSPVDVVQPDLVVVLDGSRDIVKATMIRGTPDLLVEILSPSTQHVDRNAKAAIYARSRVPEYWIVDPVACSVEQWLLDQHGSYRLATTSSDQLCSPKLGDISLATLWC